MEFNINNYVYVKLTPLGRKIHLQQHEKYCGHYDYYPQKEDAEGWSKWQMHNLMNLFGEHVGPGLRLPFETTIRIVESS